MIWPFSRKPAPAPRQEVKILLRDRCEVTTSEWRTDKALVSMAMHVLADPNFRLMIDCLNNSSPAHWVGEMTMEQRAAMQARTEGYQMALTDLKSLGTLKAIETRMPDATFEPEILE